MSDLRIPNIGDPRARAAGYVNWIFEPEAIASSAAPTSQAIHAQAIWLPFGQQANGVALLVATAGSGTVPGAFQVGLCDPSGKLQAVSANLNSNAGLTATGVKQFAFASPYTPAKADSSGGLFYVLVLENGTFGTTNVQFGRSQSLGLNALSAAVRLSGNAGTGKTSIGSVGSTLTLADGSAANFWAGVY